MTQVNRFNKRSEPHGLDSTSSFNCSNARVGVKSGYEMITEQQRIDGQIKRRERRDRLIAESGNLKLDWMDKPEWERLASHFGVRLPAWYEPAQPKFARKVLRKVGLKQTEYENLTGHKIQDTIKMNPNMPAFALVGLTLEDIRALYPDL